MFTHATARNLTAATIAGLALITGAGTAAAQTSDPVRFETVFDSTMDDGRNESCSYEKDIVNLGGAPVTVVAPDGTVIRVAAGGSERVRLYDVEALNGFTANETAPLEFEVDGVTVVDPLSVAPRCASPVTPPPTTVTPPTTVPAVVTPPVTPPAPPAPPAPVTPTVPTVPAPVAPPAVVSDDSSTLTVKPLSPAAPPVPVLNDTPMTELPYTGVDADVLAGLAALLIGLGTATVKAANRMNLD